MLKKLAIAAFVALSSFTAVPAAMAEPTCHHVTGGIVCGDQSYRAGWDYFDLISFTLSGYDWTGTVSCRDNPTTFTWQYETYSGYAPEYFLSAFTEAYCETRLYG